MKSFQFCAVIRDYRRLRTLVPLGTLRTKKDYTRAVEMLDAILDEVGTKNGVRAEWHLLKPKCRAG